KIRDMKTKLLSVAVAAVFFVFSMVSCSQPTNQKEASNNAETTASAETASNVKTAKQTITGKTLDISCYMDNVAKGQGPQKCAYGCILTKRLPAGILGQDGQVYILLEDHDNTAAYETALHHAADNVSITGNVVVKNGINSLIVEKVD